jgi:ATP-dependent DNA helicase RecG
MDLLEKDVSKIPQVGPKSKALLNRMGIFTVEDLLYHFPFRYEDRSEIKKIEGLIPGENATIKATLTSVENIFTRGRKRITKGAAKDSSGEVSLTWFNMHYIKRSLKVGETYFISGKVTAYRGKNTFMVPDMEKEGEKNLNSGRIVPVHFSTEGITPKWMRTRINDVLGGKAGSLDLDEFLPDEIIREQKFVDLEEALNQIHFPQSQVNLKKARERLAFEELFVEMINMERVRRFWDKDKKAFPLREGDEEINSFEQNLPFKLTKDQKDSVEEILEDMRKETPMNRLLEGDVGTGKTIVAAMAALKACLNGKNVLYMAPTEILAEQHFDTFKRFVGEWLSDISLLTGKGKVEFEGTAKAPEMGSIVIGTHALLYSKQDYEDVGLVIIDEQHRFGVEQRAKIAEINDQEETPHVLTMTATPIPRTLALTLYGDLDISILREHPNSERNITTKVVPGTKQDEVYRWIAKKGLSAFVVCPFVEESFAENLENVKAATAEFDRLVKDFFDEKDCALLHGRMDSDQKADVVRRFKEGEVKVLVATPVIEVGIDVPDADVMVIESAERYGLASLHQLRGRVGRGQKEGYCFVFPSAYSKDSYKRLKNLEETLDGLKLAEIDLKMRGKGDIYGKAQHGFERLRLANTNDIDFVKNVRENVDRASKALEDYPKLLEHLERRKGHVAAN